MIERSEKHYPSFNKNHVRFFYFEEDSYCSEGTRDQVKFEKIHGFYVLIGGIVLLASICILGLDLVLHKPIHGQPIPVEAEPAPFRRRHNTPASTFSNTPPGLSPMEYWI